MNNEDLELAAFQACFLNALHGHETASAIIAAMADDDAALPFMDYIAGFEPEMLEVAALLVKKWGVKSREPNPGGLHEMPH
jgi:hypothetical protein